MDDVKHCPRCGGPLMLYYVPGFRPVIGGPGGAEGFGLKLLLTLTAGILVVVAEIAMDTWNWHQSSRRLVDTAIVATAGAAFVLARYSRRGKHETKKHGHYACTKCDLRFEGDGLRPLP